MPVHPVVKLYCVQMQIPHPFHIQPVPIAGGKIRQEAVADLGSAVGNHIKRAFPDAAFCADPHTVAARRHIRQYQHVALPDGLQYDWTLHAEERR